MSCPSSKLNQGPAPAAGPPPDLCRWRSIVTWISGGNLEEHSEGRLHSHPGAEGQGRRGVIAFDKAGNKGENVMPNDLSPEKRPHSISFYVILGAALYAFIQTFLAAFSHFVVFPSRSADFSRSQSNNQPDAGSDRREEITDGTGRSGIWSRVLFYWAWHCSSR